MICGRPTRPTGGSRQTPPPLCKSAPPSLPAGGGGLCNSGRLRRPDDVARGYPLTLFPLCNSVPWRRWQRRASDFCMEWVLSDRF